MDEGTTGQSPTELPVSGLIPVEAASRAEELQRLNAELRESQLALATQLEDAQRLQFLSAQMSQTDDPNALYEIVLDTAMGVMRSDRGLMQVLDEHDDALRVLSLRGFDSEFGQLFEVSRPDDKTAGSLARQHGERVVVPDVEQSDFFADTPVLDVFRKAGVRALQSTPLVSRDGQLIGMVTTYWRQRHEPCERELRMLDVVARQGADLIERARAGETRARLAAIVESSDDAIISKTLRGFITSWNQGAERIFGYSAQEAIGRSVTLLIPLDRGDEEDGILARISRGECVDHYETVRRRKDGSLIDVSLTISPIKDNLGRVIGASKIARDITPRRLAEKAMQLSEERYRSLTQVITSVVWNTAPDGRFIKPQPSWSDYTGQTWEELRDFGWANALHADDRQRVRELWEAACAAESLYSADGRLWHAPSGTYRHFEARAVPIFNDDGSVREWVGTCIDVQDRKEAEEVLRLYAASLSESDRRKTEFLATLAHELRNPLAPIRNAVKIVRMAENDWSIIQSAIDMIERQVGHMVRLVEQLLDVSRVSIGRIRLRKEAVEIATVANDAVDIVRAQIGKKEQELAVRLPEHAVYLDADLTRLVQVLGNLLTNASKFTPKGGLIWLDVTSGDDKVVVRVRDSGIGIASDQLSRIFEMFTQVDTSLERTVGGLGIGLPLAKSLVEMHGGTLEAHSAGLGQGSEFVVRLPILTGAQLTSPESSDAYAGLNTST